MPSKTFHPSSLAASNSSLYAPRAARASELSVPSETDQKKELRALATLHSFVAIFSRLVDFPYGFANAESLLIFRNSRDTSSFCFSSHDATSNRISDDNAAPGRNQASEEEEEEFLRDIKYNFQLVQFLCSPLRHIAKKSSQTFNLPFVIKYLNESGCAGELNLVDRLPIISDFFRFTRIERLQFLVALSGIQSEINEEFLNLVSEKCMPEYLRQEYYGPSLDGYIYWIMIDYRGDLRIFSEPKHLANDFSGHWGDQIEFLGNSIGTLKNVISQLIQELDDYLYLIKNKQKSLEYSSNNSQNYNNEKESDKNENLICVHCQNFSLKSSDMNDCCNLANSNCTVLSKCNVCGFAQHAHCYSKLDVDESNGPLSGNGDQLDENVSNSEMKAPDPGYIVNQELSNAGENNDNYAGVSNNADESNLDDDEELNRKCLVCLHKSTIDDLTILVEWFTDRKAEVQREDAVMLRKLERQLKMAIQLDKKCQESIVKYNKELANYEEHQESMDNSTSRLMTDQLTALLRIMDSNQMNLNKYLEEINLRHIHYSNNEDNSDSNLITFTKQNLDYNFDYHATLRCLNDLVKNRKVIPNWQRYFSTNFAIIYNLPFVAHHNEIYESNTGKIISQINVTDRDQLASAFDYFIQDSPLVTSNSYPLSPLSNNSSLYDNSRFQNHTINNENSNHSSSNNFAALSSSDYYGQNGDSNGAYSKVDDPKTLHFSDVNYDDLGQSTVKRKRGRPKGSRSKPKNNQMQDMSDNPESNLNKLKNNALNQDDRAYSNNSGNKNGFDDEHRQRTGSKWESQRTSRRNSVKTEQHNPMHNNNLNPNARKQVTSFKYNYLDAYENQMRQMDVDSQRFPTKHIVNNSNSNEDFHCTIMGYNQADMSDMNIASHSANLQFGIKNPFDMMLSENSYINNDSFLNQVDNPFSLMNSTSSQFNSDMKKFRASDEAENEENTKRANSVENKCAIVQSDGKTIDPDNDISNDKKDISSNTIVTRSRRHILHDDSKTTEKLTINTETNGKQLKSKTPKSDKSNRLVESSDEESEYISNTDQTLSQKHSNDRCSTIKNSWHQPKKISKLTTNSNNPPHESADYGKSTNEEDADANNLNSNKDIPIIHGNDCDNEIEMDDLDESKSSIHSQDIQDVLDSFFETGTAQSVMAIVASTTSDNHENDQEFDDIASSDFEQLNFGNEDSKNHCKADDGALTERFNENKTLLIPSTQISMNNNNNQLKCGTDAKSRQSMQQRLSPLPSDSDATTIADDLGDEIDECNLNKDSAKKNNGISISDINNSDHGNRQHHNPDMAFGEDVNSSFNACDSEASLSSLHGLKSLDFDFIEMY